MTHREKVEAALDAWDKANSALHDLYATQSREAARGYDSWDLKDAIAKAEKDAEDLWTIYSILDNDDPA